jgi:2-polyprenyl-6-methoxyphenol hydroxylase-like FAD-dependent oxidoreductase
MMDSRKALIIGGGIAGTTAALAFHKAGIEPAIYEAHTDAADGTGAFLTVATNGIDALRALNADEAVLAAGFPTPSITLRSGTGKRLGETRTGIPLADGTQSHTLKRADLHRNLRDLANGRGIATEHRKRLVGARHEGGRVRARFADDTDAVGDILVGCDGVHSAARSIIDPSAPAPRYEGLLTTGGYTRKVAVGTDAGTYEMVFGRRAFFGYVQDPTGEVWWFANVPSRRPPTGAPPAGDVLRWMLHELFAQDAGPACELIAATSHIAPLSPIHTVPRLPTWHQRRMIVIGDAAHAPSPTSGQGASLSIEDAVVLALTLREEPDIERAFWRFERTRRARVEPIVKWAARINNSKAPGTVGRIMRDAMLPRILKVIAGSTAQRKPFEHHVEWTTEPVVA